MDQARPAAPALTPRDRRAYELNLPIYYVFTFISEFQLWFPIWVAYLLIQRGLSLTEVAIIDAPFWLIVLAAEVPTGAVADRWGRSTSLVLGALVYAAALVAFGLAPTLPFIMVSYFIWAVALTFTLGADSALLYDTLKRLGREHEYEKYAGRGMAMRSSAILLATIVGGPIAAATSLATPMFISAGILLAAAMVGLALKEPPRLEAGGAQLSYVDGVRAAARTVWRTPALRYLLPFSAVLLAATMATDTSRSRSCSRTVSTSAGPSPLCKCRFASWAWWAPSPRFGSLRATAKYAR